MSVVSEVDCGHGLDPGAHSGSHVVSFRGRRHLPQWEGCAPGVSRVPYPVSEVEKNPRFTW